MYVCMYVCVYVYIYIVYICNTCTMYYTVQLKQNIFMKGLERPVDVAGGGGGREASGKRWR